MPSIFRRIEDKEYANLFLFAKKVALAVEKVVNCKRIGIAVLGLEVAHAHIHLVPINTVYDIEFSRPKLSLPKEEFLDLAGRIGAEFEKANQ
jgi:histidine triad (HIT) family protein